MRSPRSRAAPLSGEGKSADIAGIEGFLPFDVRVDRVRLGDPLEVDGARFHLVPSALLRLKVEIAAVGAERVACRRLARAVCTRRLASLEADIELGLADLDGRLDVAPGVVDFGFAILHWNWLPMYSKAFAGMQWY